MDHVLRNEIFLSVLGFDQPQCWLYGSRNIEYDLKRWVEEEKILGYSMLAPKDNRDIEVEVSFKKGGGLSEKPEKMIVCFEWRYKARPRAEDNLPVY